MLDDRWKKLKELDLFFADSLAPSMNQFLEKD